MTAIGPTPLTVPSSSTRPNITASLLIRALPPRDEIRIGVPFRVGYTLAFATALDSGSFETLGINVQFLQSGKADPLAMRDSSTGSLPVSGGFIGNEGSSSTEGEHRRDGRVADTLEYPEPYLDYAVGDAAEALVDGFAEHVGTSILSLPPRWTTPTPGTNERSCDFDAEFIAFTKGLLQVGGGLRVFDRQRSVLAEWSLIGQILVK